MTADPHTLRAAAMEADARCNTARKTAEEAQRAAYWPGAGVRDNGAEAALEAYFVAYEVAVRAWRAVRDAEKTVEAARSAEQVSGGSLVQRIAQKAYKGVTRDREAS